MRTLMVIPQTRRIGVCVASWLKLDFDGQLDMLVVRGGDDPDAHRYANITRKCEYGRQVAVAQGYDYLWLVDDDMVLPPDALNKLKHQVETGADIAYGFCVWRVPTPRWSAALKLAEPFDVMTLDDDPERTRQAWGQVIDCVGVGSYCTLLPRRIFEQITFERRGVHCFDFYLSLDAQAHGWRQVMDLSVVCGHVSLEGRPRILWPEPGDRPGEMFRAEVL